MGKRREVSKMLSVSDGYWGFVHQKRLYRYAYAALTFFAIFALVVSFFKVGDGTQYAPDYVKEKLKLTVQEREENEALLQWIYALYPTPLVAAWFVVYFGKFLFCWRIKRLRKARNFKYNLLLATVVMAIGYAIFFKMLLKMDVIDGPRFRVAMILLLCECCLIGIAVFDMHKTRQARHQRKRLLRKQQETEDAIRRQLQSGEVMEDGDADPSPIPSFPHGKPGKRSPAGVLV